MGLDLFVYRFVLYYKLMIWRDLDYFYFLESIEAGRRNKTTATNPGGSDILISSVNKEMIRMVLD